LDITWFGHAAMRIRARQTYVIMDPCDKESGFDMGRPTTDVITISNPSPHHSNIKGVKGDSLVVDGPGEYEIEGVQLIGIATYLRPPEDETPAQRNTIFLLEAEEMRLGHLGALGAPLTSDQAGQIAGVDILIVPIGGDEPFDAAEAARTVRQLEPKVVIPVVYPVKGEGADKDGPLQQFVSTLGVEPELSEARLTIARRDLGESLRLLQPSPRG
jgi:L-ascorbate metabolism protein UlaG (beta-lactamase superfamily)